MQQQRQDRIVEGDNHCYASDGSRRSSVSFLTMSRSRPVLRLIPRSRSMVSASGRASSFLEVGDPEAPHLPLALCIADVASDSKHTDRRLEQAAREVRRDIPRRLAVVDDLPILNVDRHDLLLAAHHDRNPVKLPFFAEGSVLFVQLFRVTRKREELRALSLRAALPTRCRP